MGVFFFFGFDARASRRRSSVMRAPGLAQKTKTQSAVRPAHGRTPPAAVARAPTTSTAGGGRCYPSYCAPPPAKQAMAPPPRRSSCVLGGTTSACALARRKGTKKSRAPRPRAAPALTPHQPLTLIQPRPTSTREEIWPTSADAYDLVEVIGRGATATVSCGGGGRSGRAHEKKLLPPPLGFRPGRAGGARIGPPIAGTASTGGIDGNWWGWTGPARAGPGGGGRGTCGRARRDTLRKGAAAPGPAASRATETPT